MWWMAGSIVVIGTPLVVFSGCFREMNSSILKEVGSCSHGTFKLSNQIAQFAVNTFHTHLLGGE